MSKNEQTNEIYTWTQAIFGRITAHLIVLAKLLPAIYTTYDFGWFWVGCLKSGITILLLQYKKSN